MPLEVRQRHRHSDGALVVSLVRPNQVIQEWTWQPGGATMVDRTDDVEVWCMTFEDAESLAPKLMEWAIQRKMKERS